MGTRTTKVGYRTMYGALHIKGGRGSVEEMEDVSHQNRIENSLLFQV